MSSGKVETMKTFKQFTKHLQEPIEEATAEDVDVLLSKLEKQSGMFDIEQLIKVVDNMHVKWYRRMFKGILKSLGLGFLLQASDFKILDFSAYATVLFRYEHTDRKYVIKATPEVDPWIEYAEWVIKNKPTNPLHPKIFKLIPFESSKGYQWYLSVVEHLDNIYSTPHKVFDELNDVSESVYKKLVYGEELSDNIAVDSLSNTDINSILLYFEDIYAIYGDRWKGTVDLHDGNIGYRNGKAVFFDPICRSNLRDHENI